MGRVILVANVTLWAHDLVEEKHTPEEVEEILEEVLRAVGAKCRVIPVAARRLTSDVGLDQIGQMTTLKRYFRQCYKSDK